MEGSVQVVRLVLGVELSQGYYSVLGEAGDTTKTEVGSALGNSTQPFGPTAVQH
jgi:hypothetical protein